MSVAVALDSFWISGPVTLERYRSMRIVTRLRGTAVSFLHCVKGVLCYSHVLFSLSFCRGPELSGSPPSCGAVFQPLSHIYGVCLTLMYLVWGTKVIILPKFTLDSYVKVIAEEKV